MIQNDVHEFKEKFEKLAKFFDVDPPSGYVTFETFAALSDLTKIDVFWSLEEIKKTHDFKRLPYPAEFRTLISNRRRFNPPQVYYSGCSLCDGTGFTTIYLRLIPEKVTYGKLPVPSRCLELGIMEQATQQDYQTHNGRVYSYAVPCQCSQQKMA